MSEFPTYPPQKRKKDQTRPCLNVQSKRFYFSAYSLWLKSTSTACLESRNVYRTMENYRSLRKNIHVSAYFVILPCANRKVLRTSA